LLLPNEFVGVGLPYGDSFGGGCAPPLPLCGFPFRADGAGGDAADFFSCFGINASPISTAITAIPATTALMELAPFFFSGAASFGFCAAAAALPVPASLRRRKR
jgi:hypothetical protein